MPTNEQPDAFGKDSGVLIVESILQSLLPPSHRLELNAKMRMLSLLSADPPHILAQAQFTNNEWSILLMLFASYPHYAPHEILLASITSLSPQDCRERLQEAQQKGSKVWKQELKPVQRALCGVRAKLNELNPHLKISLIRDAGYALTTALQ